MVFGRVESAGKNAASGAEVRCPGTVCGGKNPPEALKGLLPSWQG